MLRLGFVSIIRPLFQGDSPKAAQRSLEALKTLGEELEFQVITPSVSGNDDHVATGQAIPAFAVSNLGAAQQAAGQLADEALDFLLIQHTTFTTGDLLVPLLHAAKRVGVWALPESSGGLGAAGPLPLNALCGLNMTLSFLDHPQVDKSGPVKWFYGEVRDDWFQERLRPTLQALRGLQAVEQARILQVGGTAPGFYGIEERPDLASVTVDTMTLAEMFARVETVPRGQARARAETWAREEASDLSVEKLESAARVELALGAVASEGDYQALALRCWPEFPESCDTMICAAVAGMGDREVPTACEGDVMGALSMLALQGLSREPSVLLDLSDIDRADDSLQFWHCGNAPRSWAARPGSRLTTHFNRTDLGVVRDMSLRPGPATGFRLLNGGRSALVCSGAFASPSKPGFDGVHGWLGDLRWDGARVSARGFVANILDNRLPHHIAFGSGALTEGVRELCSWLGAKPLPLKSERTSL